MTCGSNWRMLLTTISTVSCAVELLGNCSAKDSIKTESRCQSREACSESVSCLISTLIYVWSWLPTDCAFDYLLSVYYQVNLYKWTTKGCSLCLWDSAFGAKIYSPIRAVTSKIPKAVSSLLYFFTFLCKSGHFCIPGCIDRLLSCGVTSAGLTSG